MSTLALITACSWNICATEKKLFLQRFLLKMKSNGERYKSDGWARAQLGCYRSFCSRNDPELIWRLLLPPPLVVQYILTAFQKALAHSLARLVWSWWDEMLSVWTICHIFPLIRPPLTWSLCEEERCVTALIKDNVFVWIVFHLGGRGQIFVC